jgi:hypothetical protein
MKVFVLHMIYVGDDHALGGIFSSWGKANDAKKVLEARYLNWSFWIVEETVDPCVCNNCMTCV